MKTLFIGLGGNGVKAVSTINKKLKSYYSFLKQNNNLIVNPNLSIADIETDEFLFIDTEYNAIVNQVEDINNDAIILRTTSLAVWNSQEAIPKDPSSLRFFSWFDQNKAKLNNESLEKGAGAIRMYGRMGLFSYKNRFEQLLHNKLNNLHTRAGVGKDYTDLNTRIYIFSGTSGGTGSGMLFDVLMSVYCIARNINLAADPEIITVLFGPQQTLTIENNPKIITKKLRNAAAFFRELDAIIKFKNSPNAIVENYRSFNEFISWVPNPQLSSPFAFSERILYFDNTFVDCNNNFTSGIDYDYIHDIVADVIFNLESGSINKNIRNVAKNAAASLTSKLQNATGLTTNNPSGYNDMFESFCPLILQYPKEIFAEYCKRKYNKEFLEFILGEKKSGNKLINEKSINFKVQLNELIERISNSCKPLYESVISANKDEKVLLATLTSELNIQKARINESAEKLSFIYNAINSNEQVQVIKQHCEDYFKSLFAELSLNSIAECIFASDESITVLSNNLKDKIKKLPEKTVREHIAGGFMKGQFWEYICDFIKISIYDLCSYQSTGYLDLLLGNINTLIDNFNIKYNDALRAYNSDFISFLNSEKSNKFKIFIPSLDKIVQTKNDTSCYVEKNEFEENYKKTFTTAFLKQVISSFDIKVSPISSPFSISSQTDYFNVVNYILKDSNNKFNNKYNGDSDIQNYQNKDILPLLQSLPDEGLSIKSSFAGFNGVLFPANPDKIKDNAVEKVLIGSFNGDNVLANSILNGAIIVDDKFYSDRLVALYFKRDLSPGNLSHMDEYVKNLLLTSDISESHPAFIDKRFENVKIIDLLSSTLTQVNKASQHPLAVLKPHDWFLYLLSILAIKNDITHTLVDANNTFNRPATDEYPFQFNSANQKFTLKVLNDKIQLLFPSIKKHPITGVLNINPSVSLFEVIASTSISQTKENMQYILQCIDSIDLEKALLNVKWAYMFNTLLMNFYTNDLSKADECNNTLATILKERNLTLYNDLHSLINS